MEKIQKNFVLQELLNNSLNLAIDKFCQNLRKLSVEFKKLETLKIVFNSCQYLESIDIWCGYEYLSEKDALEVAAKYSPENVCELKFIYDGHFKPDLSLEEWESFFINWANRLPQKSLVLTISGHHCKGFITIAKFRKITNKYIKLGVIKKFFS